MLVICVRRKYVTLIYDLPRPGGGYLGEQRGVIWAGELQILPKIM